MIEYLIGVDGGGSGTRVRLARADGALLATGASGPSALLHGIASAWSAVRAAIDQAFAAAGLAQPAPARIGLGLGLAGVHNKQWAADFLAADPGYGAIALGSDGQTTLLGAHQGRPGAIVALGTGSVGEVLAADGQRREVGGWGFPAGDEAGGAWIGLRAIGHLQQVLDGRAAPSPFAAALAEQCGGGGRDGLQRWLAGANQTAYATLARLVLAHAADTAPARLILDQAGAQVALMVQALDPGGALPVALCGGLASPLTPYLPAALQTRLVPAHGDSAMGALLLISQQVRVSPDQVQPC